MDGKKEASKQSREEGNEGRKEGREENSSNSKIANNNMQAILMPFL